MAPLRCSFLLAGWEWTVELSIDEKVGEDAAGAPRYPVRPSFDARSGFFVDENVAADNELIALAIMRASEAVREGAIKTSLKNNERVLGGFDVTFPSGHAGRSLAAACCTHHKSNYALPCEGSARGRWVKIVL